MKDGPLTRPSLLVRLKDTQDREAWIEFVDLYAPVVFGFARRRGFQDADAADLTQEVLRSVAGAISRFDYVPARGGFRAWLFQITKNHLRSCLRRISRRMTVAPDAGSVELDDLGDPDADMDDVWEMEWRREVFGRACRHVRPQVSAQTWEAFYRTAVLARPGGQVAADLGLSLPAVYLAKSRVLGRIREYVESLEQE